jgi:DNA-binding NarL/FixJ family response regulator
MDLSLNNEKLKIMVLNDEADTENVMDDIERERPNVYVIDHKLPGTKDGIDLATEILAKYPSSSILFVTANEYLESELSKHRIFDGKKLKVLLKSAGLQQIENDMLDLVREKPYPQV